MSIEKAKDIAQNFLDGKMPRREFLSRTAQLGLGAAALAGAFGSVANRSLAASFDWKKHKGSTIRLLLNKHPYADAMVADLPAFKSLTGMDVKYDLFPEDVYFDKVTAALSSKSSNYDAFMTGAYQTWTYGPAGWIVDMNEYLEDSSKTSPEYDWQDVLPNLRASTAWSGVAGEELGGPGSYQWAIPWGFEFNSVSYNRVLFDKLGITPPVNLPDMKEKAAKIKRDAGGPYGIGVRGSRSWATIHPGYLSGFTNYGARDFVKKGSKLEPSMNSAAGKEFTQLWVDMIRDSGPRNWATYTWYEVGTDLAAGASGMIFDADILGYFMNGAGNKESGNLGFHAFASNPDESEPTSNVWIWSLAMSKFSKQRDATWDFIQWASSREHGLFGAREMDFVNPVRGSVFNDPAFRQRISSGYPGYLEQYEASEPNGKIYFTPQQLFSNLTTEWAASLQKMVAGEVPVGDGLDDLAENITRQLKQVGLS